MAHGPYNGTSNPEANPPLPTPLAGEGFKLLTDWVEKGTAPGKVVLKSLSSIPVAKTLPMCAYPKSPSYVGGDAYAEGSYECR
jgi:feruloyl esterase